jgi:hypothetical protein
MLHLDEIEARQAQALNGKWADCVVTIVERDIPALVTEVRRLQEENGRLSNQAHTAWANAAQTRDILREATTK